MSCIPVKLGRAKTIKFKSLVHPVVKNCVANSIELENQSLLVTGSNMSGKSTFIKAININVILAQTLNTALAEDFECPILDIATSIRIADNITNDTSYFMREVQKIGEIVELSHSSAQYLFTIDEIFKGTNARERISSAKAILEYINGGDAIVLISTHDLELTQL